MFCTSCGTKLNDDARFCTNCGNAVIDIDAPKPAGLACSLCSKPLGLNRYLIGKSASGKSLWKCPACAKKGGYLKIVGERAYMCTKDGVILDSENYNTEIRVLCNSCGHLYCYAQSDLEKNESLMKTALRERALATGNALFGSPLVMQANSSRADSLESQVVDYSKCPNCHSADVQKLTPTQWTELKKQRENAFQNVSVADELKKFKDLLDMGAITQEEFDAQKQRLLG